MEFPLVRFSSSSSSSRSLLLCLLGVSFLFVGTQAFIQLPANETVEALIVFGDSIVDAGNNNNLITPAKCNFPPYGIDFEGGVPTGRFSDGKVPSDIIAEELGIKGLLPAYLNPDLTPQDLITGVTFASGASGFDPLTPKVAEQSAISLSDQLKYFAEYEGRLKAIVGKERADFILGKSLFVIVAGSNDITNTYYAGRLRTQYSIESYTDLMLNSAVEFLAKLHGFGARRIAVLSLPPIGCLPSQRTLAGGPTRNCVKEYNEAAKLFNSKLSQALVSLLTSLPNSKLVYMDIYNILLDLIMKPGKYGFEIATKGCCGTGLLEASILCNQLTSSVCANVSAHIFWDGYHPTERAYRIIVSQLIERYINKF